jgi:hypothetical protein
LEHRFGDRVRAVLWCNASVDAVSELGSGPPSPDEPLALSDAEKQALIALLRHTIDEARFPYAPRLAPLKAILDKLVPPAPRPPPRAGLGPSHGGGRRW